MKSRDLLHKASVAISSSELLLQSGDFDGACNRAYYAMFDAARARDRRKLSRNFLNQREAFYRIGIARNKLN